MMHPAPKIRPITDLKKTSEISEYCHRVNEPVFITKNGYSDLVVMSVEAYEKMMFMQDLYRKLAEAEQALSDGQVMSGEESINALIADSRQKIEDARKQKQKKDLLP